MVNLGNINIADLRLGATQVKALYLGSEQVWGGEEPAPVTGPWLCFTAEEANSTVQLDKVGSPNAVSLETSTDGNAWTDYSWSGNTGDTLTLTNVGDKIYFRAKNDNTKLAAAEASDYHNFVITGTVSVSGNIMTLLKADGSLVDLGTLKNRYAFACLFDSCTAIVDASGLQLPSSKAVTACYANLFYGCSNLTATPSLPATTLYQYCYGSMFSGCSSLTSAPKLLATSISYNCYVSMFQGCSSLSSVEVAFTTWPTGATINWLSGVAATGEFICPAGLSDTRGVSNIPVGWTKVDAT